MPICLEDATSLSKRAGQHRLIEFFGAMITVALRPAALDDDFFSLVLETVLAVDPAVEQVWHGGAEGTLKPDVE